MQSTEFHECVLQNNVSLAQSFAYTHFFCVVTKNTVKHFLVVCAYIYNYCWK
jgi:hypothetical protein